MDPVPRFDPCPRCGASREAVLDEQGVGLRCPRCSPPLGADPSPALEDLRRRADAITARILYGDESELDLEIAAEVLRDEVGTRFPARLWLFDAIYLARWRRLREQGWAHPGSISP
jgi:hypothetical protein